jgi:hypothetical protein
MTGRELVLAHLEIGSTWLWLADAASTAASWIKGAAEVAKAAEELGSFTKKLKDGLKPKAVGVLGHELAASDDSVDKSIVAMAKVSTETNSTIRLRKTIKTDIAIETLEIEVTPHEAKAARARVRSKPKKRKAISSSAPGSIDVNYLAGAMRALPPAIGDIEAIIRVLVQTHMRLGSTYVLEQVATTLEHEGRSDIANIIRQILGGRRGQADVEV